MITNWIITISQIRVIVAIDLRDDEDIMIVTNLRQERVSAMTFSSHLIYLGSGPNYSIIIRKHITRSVFKILYVRFL